ncbi:MAG: DUF3148 domain-containing protein [Phormidesmis sp.]
MTISPFNVGDRIRIHTRPPYIKSADPMPMLRPPDLVEIGDEGTILSRKPGGYLGVRFARGTFLIDAQYVEALPETTAEADATDPKEKTPGTPTETV